MTDDGATRATRVTRMTRTTRMTCTTSTTDQACPASQPTILPEAIISAPACTNSVPALTPAGDG